MPAEELLSSGTEVIRAHRLPWWVREVEMTDGTVVPLSWNVFAFGCGCLVWASLLGGSAAAAIALWVRDGGTAMATAGAALLGAGALIVGWRFLERRDAEARAICLSGLTEHAADES